MYFRANTTASILSDETTQDAFGDPVDNSTVEVSGVPMSIIEQSVTADSEVSTTPRSIRYCTGRMSPAYKGLVSSNHRILDEKTGETYIILNVSDIGNPLGTRVLRLDLRHTT